MKEILLDLGNRLGILIDEGNIVYYNDGATDSVVFSVNNRYLIKTMDDNTFNAQLEFLEFYKGVREFQRVIYFSRELKYICFEYIEGDKFYKTKIDSNNVIEQLYNIVSSYKVYDNNYFGYLYEDRKSWFLFLKDEVDYSYEKIKYLDISIDKVYGALDRIKSVNIDKYLIHGDFGTHNFIVSDNKIRVIDPMPVVGDYLYDFYFAIFSDASIFKGVEVNYILNYFLDRDNIYKRDIMVIAFFVRMCRCYVYNIKDFDLYLDYYGTI